MVQIVDKGPSAISSFIQHASPGIDKAIERLLQKKEDKSLGRLGFDVEGVRDPNIRNLLLQGEQASQKQQNDSLMNKEAETTMATYFGPDFAKVWAIQSPQSRGSMMAEAMQTLARNEDVGKIIQKYEAAGGRPIQQQRPDINKNIPEESEAESVKLKETITPQGETISLEEEDEIGEPPIKYPEKGMLPKEKIQIQTQRAKDFIAREEKRIAPYLEKIAEERQALPLKKNAIEQMKSAIQRGGNLTTDWLADTFNMPFLRTDEGAQLKLATKEFLLGNIGRVGARPNQWIEQQIAQMAPQVGVRPSANLKMAAGLEFENDISQKRIDLTSELEEKYLREWEYVPGNLDSIVDKKLRPYVEERQKDLAYQLAQITQDYESPSEFQHIKKVVQGTPLTLRKGEMLKEKIREQTPNDSNEELNKKTAQLARKLGYEIPSGELVRKYRR